MIGREVYIVDCCLPIDTMRELAAEAHELYWYDHHAGSTAIAAELGWGCIDERECGATLTWRQLYPDEPLPELLAYVRDKDLWQWRLPDGRAIVAALESRLDDDNLDQFWEWSREELLAEGQPLLAEQQRQARRIVRRGVRSQDAYGRMGRTAWVMNTGELINESADLACQPLDAGGQGADLAVCFHLRPDGRWLHSLRSTKVDCRRIAEDRNGGGHSQAAAYIATVPFPLADDCLDWPD